MDTTQAEETVRKILQQSLQRPQGVPADDGDRAELLNGFKVVIASVRAHLVKVAGSRAAAAFAGFKYQDAGDVVHDAFLDAWDRLDVQFTLGAGALAPIPCPAGGASKKRRFIFDPAGELSLVGWIAVLIGTGLRGPKSGVLGEYLARDHLEAARLVGIDVSDDDESLPELRGPAFDDPEHVVDQRRTYGRFLDVFYAKLEKSKPQERFAIECIWLFFELEQGREPAEFWSAIEALTASFLREDQHTAAMSAVNALREKTASGAKLRKGDFLEMLGKIVDRSSRQLSRWYNDHVESIRKALAGETSVPKDMRA